MKVQYRITEDDYVNLARFHVRRNYSAWLSTVKVVAGAIAVAVLVIIAWTLPEWAPFLAFIAACGAIGGALGFFIRLFIHTPIRARRHYRQYKSMQEPFTAEMTDAGIRFSNPDGEGNLPWSKLFQWRQSDQFILIYSMPILYYPVPKSIEREGFDIPLLIQRLTEHLGPER